MIRSVDIRARQYSASKDSMIGERSDSYSPWGIGSCVITPLQRVGPYLVVSLAGWALGIQRHPDSPIVLVHCQDLKKVPQPGGMMSWIEAPQPEGAPTVPVWAPVQWPALHRDPPL